jgi:hypothetical protein
MGRLVLVAFAIAMPAGTAWSQPASSPNPWHVNIEPQAVHEPDLSLADTGQLYSGQPDSRIIAGTEVMPNGMFGIGMFGEKTAPRAHAPATVRDFSLPRNRKPAVGFSLKF